MVIKKRRANFFYFHIQLFCEWNLNNGNSTFFITSVREACGISSKQSKKGTEWNSRNLFLYQFNRSTVGSVDREKNAVNNWQNYAMHVSQHDSLLNRWQKIFLLIFHPQLAARAFMQLFWLLIHLRQFSRVWLLMKL